MLWYTISISVSALSNSSLVAEIAFENSTCICICNMYICMYVYIYIYIYIYTGKPELCVRLVARRGRAVESGASRAVEQLGLYTILLLPILYGVWHTQGGSGGGRIFPNHRAVVLQQCGQCRWADKRKGRLIRAQTTRSKTISCTGQRAARGALAHTRVWRERVWLRERTKSELGPVGLIYICIYIYVYICVCIYIYIYICIYIYIYIYIYICIHIYIDVYIDVGIYVYTCACIHIYLSIYMCVCVWERESDAQARASVSVRRRRG